MVTLTKRERDCLFSIAEISSGKRMARLFEVSKKINVSGPTTLNLVRRLEKKNLIRNNRGVITITQKGMYSYKSILLIHRCFESIFSEAGINAEVACKNAGMFDYNIGQDVGKMLLNILKVSKCPHGKPINGVS